MKTSMALFTCNVCLVLASKSDFEFFLPLELNTGKKHLVQTIAFDLNRVSLFYVFWSTVVASGYLQLKTVTTLTALNGLGSIKYGIELNVWINHITANSTSDMVTIIHVSLSGHQVQL